MPYGVLLLVLAIIQHTRGNYVWTQCVHEVDFFAPRVGGVMQPGMVPQPQMYPMAQQPLPQQVQVQHSAGTPPVQQQMPMNTGYAQPPANTGYAQAPVKTEYAQAPTPGYAQGSPNPGYNQV
jgi:hypothetical protein